MQNFSNLVQGEQQNNNNNNKEIMLTSFTLVDSHVGFWFLHLTIRTVQSVETR